MKKKRNDNGNSFFTKFEGNIKWHLIILFILPLIIYFKVINFEFTRFDDNIIIQENIDTIGDINKIKEAFKTDAFLNKDSQSFYRPIQTVTFMFDAMVSSDNPLMYHITNLIIHLTTVISLYFFLRFLNFKNIVSFFLTLIFAVHPLFAAAVAWIPSRGDLLLGLFSIYVFMFFGYHVKTGKLIYFILHAVFFLLVIFSKETAVFFPLLLLFYYFFICKRKFELKKLLPYFLVWIFGLLFYFYIRAQVMSMKIPTDIFGIMPLIKNLPAIPTIIGKSFIPVKLSTLPLFDDTSLIIGIVVLLLLLYIVYKYSIEKKWMVMLGFAWFLLFTIPPMAYRQKFSEYMYTYLEHRTYMPTIGLIIIVAFLFNDIMVNKIKQLTLITIIIVAAFSFVASSHTDDYKDSFVFYTSAISINPNNAGAYTNRGVVYFYAKDYQTAIEDDDKAIEICEYPSAYNNRGCIELIENNFTSAERDFNKALALDSTQFFAYLNLGFGKTFLVQKYDDALNILNRAEKIDPKNPEVFYSKGTAYFFKGDYQNAIDCFTKAVTYNPKDYEAYSNRALAKIYVNDLFGAIDDCQKSVEIKPDFSKAYNNMGLALKGLNKFDEAILIYTRAISLNNDFAEAYYGRGLSKQMKNDIDGARNDLNIALQLGYSPAKDALDKIPQAPPTQQ
jgi:tetratricopeptide (TPR) repeat protein